MLIKQSPSGTPESISSLLMQFSEELLYYCFDGKRDIA